MIGTASVRASAIRGAALELFVAQGYEATSMSEIGARVGIRGPSLYKHVASKQELLVAIMTDTMDSLLAEHRSAVAGTDDPTERLRRAVEAHIRYHARHRMEAFVGNREIRSLTEPNLSEVLCRRAEYEQMFRILIADGVAAGRFRVASERIASYAILELGMGVAVWFREDGEFSENEIVWQYVDFALRLVGAA
ncbi:TetR/AcrR family transcriptional regulator [Nocardia caishijiensis]|uniref:TetR family transcriptional regulator n=1 Tax=Nocardia caishijiensis TaxID=184756 RepID=A0ABQ6YI61_9NOCA|nr:TetR/AcrR family transcriptional regulator [Nocardia caishijiensis]KAF0845194.1 TetR family transcriptional regulator [Nocardia caishijiensis]